MDEAIAIRDEVAGALRQGKPVVALEPTLIAHGLPYPDNLELASEVEALVRREGGVPATIAVIGGVPRVGLRPQELELMATGEGVAKLSARDIPTAVAKKAHGATTVAGTVHLAARAGIKLFATDGLGGVHRAARDSWDVLSADLLTLSRRSPVYVKVVELDSGADETRESYLPHRRCFLTDVLTGKPFHTPSPDVKTLSGVGSGAPPRLTFFTQESHVKPTPTL